MRPLPFCVAVLGVWCQWAAANEDFFENHVRPLLVEHCYQCHNAGEDEAAGGLTLDTAGGWRRGGASGPAIVPGDSAASLLMHAVAYTNDDMAMPPSGKLPNAQIELLRRWIDGGAVDPRRDGGEDSAQTISPPMDRDPATHWAFVPPVRPDAPEPMGGRDPIDDFFSAAAAKVGLQVAPEADDAILIRRLYFDLSGLPPSVEEVLRFVNDAAVNKDVRLVDRLLASPRFGERMGRHWLDVARYADTLGYTLAGQERRLVGSERYRDWVIGALNDDMPYDDMIRHQLAGDRTDPDNAEGNLDAMGFLTVGRRFLNPHDVIDDRIDVVTRGWLGLTVTCARCHDHKFDPIPTLDYYGLYGVFWSSEPVDGGPSPLMLRDKKKVTHVRVFERGQPGQRGEVAPRRYLTALRQPDEPEFSDGSGRWELANRIGDADNPLTARVMVNRVWNVLVGRPLVDSMSDFGYRTPPPAVPEVLDELAVDFATDWSVKRLVQRIVLSDTYRRSSRVSEAGTRIDPENRLAARGNRRRRDFESLRDSLLAVAGHLDGQIGGPPVEITGNDPTPRRTVYAMIDRQNLPGVFRTFDFASPDTHSPGRYETTVPGQSLFLMNSPQTVQLARWIANQTRHDDDTIGSMFAKVLSREPSGPERSAFERFLAVPVVDVPATVDPRSVWRYGLARVDDAGRLVGGSVEPLPVHGDRYQPLAEFPAEGPVGYGHLDSWGGHPPRDRSMAVVRRYVSPATGDLVVRMHVENPSDDGDGVVVSLQRPELVVKTMTVDGGRRPWGPFRMRMAAGEVLDLVATAGGNDTSDRFHWSATVSLAADDGRRFATRSKSDFAVGTLPDSPAVVDRLTQAAQVLLMSSEFAFVD